MAKKSSIAKQRRREVLVAKMAAKRAEYKATILDGSKSTEEQQAAVRALNELPKNSSKIRLRHRCQFTGRARGVLWKFKMSRHCFREMVHKALIPGITKASW